MPNLRLIAVLLNKNIDFEHRDGDIMVYHGDKCIVLSTDKDDAVITLDDGLEGSMQIKTTIEYLLDFVKNTLT